MNESMNEWMNVNYMFPIIYKNRMIFLVTPVLYEFLNMQIHVQHIALKTANLTFELSEIHVWLIDKL